MRVLFLITARGGSKRIPRKNLRRIAGLSLVAFKAISARRSKYCARVILSSDDPEIQEEARRHLVEVPFTRPAHLATDGATSADVVSHVVDFIESEGERYDALMLLEPAAPFARAADYDRAVEMMESTGAGVVLGMRQVSPNSLFVGSMDELGRLGNIVDRVRAWEAGGCPTLRQEYTMNAALYLLRWDFFKSHRRIYCDGDATLGYPMDPHYSIEIDDPMDLHLAEFMVERGHVDMTHWL
jgi:N-acylneuraminate cytidylyltransferase/CMP-N,N'-diacetyllegionaminic acid synthase